MSLEERRERIAQREAEEALARAYEQRDRETAKN